MTRSNTVAFALRVIARKLTFSGEPATLAEIGLFTGVPQHENFARVSDLAPTRQMPASSHPELWPRGADISIPDTYKFEGETRSSKDLLRDTDTAALLVLVDGVIRSEQYFLNGGPTVTWLSMSVAKSFISCLVGIAVDEKFIKSIDEPISDYVPVTPDSAYDGVSIRTVLNMSSGARWNEDYNDQKSDIHLLGRAMQGYGGGLDGFVANMKREVEPETVCRYNSGETQILGALLARATGKTVADYMHEKLVEPLGFESPGYWVTDMFGIEMSFGGLNLTARDFARFGELYRNGGMWKGMRIVSEEWVRASTMVDGPIREPGRPMIGDHALPFGYGYQWWIPAGDRGAFSAIGVLNQMVYVDPVSKTTIVKLSANRMYGTTTTEATNHDEANLEFLRQIVASLSP
jgi:CubicO group peptidase (beta-lactamase class C family)